MPGWRKRSRKQPETELLAEGLILKTDSFPQRESRAFTLLLKGILVYLIVMGGMGCFLSALNVDYAWWAVHLALLLTAVFCSLLYYNKWWENIGYFLLLGIMLLSGSMLQRYINSGFYAVANDMAEQASVFFDSNAMRSFGEQVSNRYLAITISMCYVGSVCCILMNVLISRQMQYVVAIPLCIGALVMPLYLELEPSTMYVVMLVSGLMAAFVIRGNGHYRLSWENTCYQFHSKKKQVSYVYAGRTLAGMMAVIFLFCFTFIQFMGAVYPAGRFHRNHTMSAVKAQTLDTVENLSLLGLMGLFNFYENTGGMANGVLGGVSAVRLDYEPDLILEFAPYADERMYFKTFIGARYEPYRNRWSVTEEMAAVANSISGNSFLPWMLDFTTLQMKAAYESGNEMSAKGLVKITNVAASVGIYLPYYSEEIQNVVYPGETVEYTYYPRVSEQGIMAAGGTKGKQGKAESKSRSGDGRKEQDWQEVSMETWLELPEENWEVIALFCQEAGLQPITQSSGAGSGLSGDTGSIVENGIDGISHSEVMAAVQKLADYYQDNIPYTFRPGLTPRGMDAINYFLLENKRGYCAHFASAATLIFRYLGIPARYVEGYAIDPEDISEEGTILYDKEYSQYFEGYSPMGETGVVSVKATDANAHAWVEVYDDTQGWQAVEVTPSTDEEADSGNSIWRRLMNLLGGGQENRAAQNASQQENGGILDENAKKVSSRAALVVMILFILATAGQWCVHKAVWGYRYRCAGWNERLIMRYQDYLRRLSRSQKELAEQLNYRQQLAWLVSHHFWKIDEAEQEACARILEQAGFSGREITEQEFCRIIQNFAYRSG